MRHFVLKNHSLLFVVNFNRSLEKEKKGSCVDNSSWVSNLAVFETVKQRISMSSNSCFLSFLLITLCHVLRLLNILVS